MFSTDKDPDKSKTMCIAFKAKVSRDQLPPVYLNEDELPWKEHVNHLGTTLHSDCTSDKDLQEKRGSFISTNYNLNQEFEHVPPEVKLKMFRLYNSHFTNSKVWSFSSESFDMLCRSYNKNLRIIYDLPLETHNWIIEDLSGGNHIRTMILSRYITFVGSLVNHKSAAIRSLFSKISSNVLTTIGANLRLIQLETGVPVIPGVTKSWEIKHHRVYSKSETEAWKIKLLQSLLEIRDQRWQILFDEEEPSGGLSNDDIIFMIRDVAIS